MDSKELFYKESDVIAKEMLLKVDKAELEAEKKKQELDEYVKLLRNTQNEYVAALTKLKEVPEGEWEAAKAKFELEFKEESVLEEINEVAKEITEKTKSFLTDLGGKVSGFYHKNMEKMKDKKEE